MVCVPTGMVWFILCKKSHSIQGQSAVSSLSQYTSNYKHMNARVGKLI